MAVSESSSQITKLGAAQRQLDAAIRMYFSGEDELAVHTVAAAAYALLQDLKRIEGRGEYTDQIGRGVFAMASDVASGYLKELPPEIGADSQLAELILTVAEQIKCGKLKSVDDFTMPTSGLFERTKRAEFNRIANFLKHAYEDHSAVLPIEKLNNELLLVAASCAYRDIVGRLTGEMLAFGLLWLAENSERVDEQAIVGKLRTLTREQRIRVCQEIAADQNAEPSVT
jgi:hypothetical protein